MRNQIASTFFIAEREDSMDEKQNIDITNGFAKQIGRTHFLVNFSFKKDTTDTIKDKTKKLIWDEATAKKG